MTHCPHVSANDSHPLPCAPEGDASSRWKSSRARTLALLALGLLGCCTCAPALAAGGDEKIISATNGIFRFEAEEGKGDWRIIDTPTGKGIQDPGQGSMSYRLQFNEAGRYYVALLARQGPLGRDKENDVCLTLDGNKLHASDHTTRPDGMRTYGDWSWTQLPKGPGAHTPRTIFNDPVYFEVPQPGVYTLLIAHRSANFAIDRVVLRKGNPELPHEEKAMQARLRPPGQNKKGESKKKTLEPAAGEKTIKAKS